MDKIEVFKTELAFIQNANIRQFTSEVINALPDYFFTIPASSTGKYHPKYTICDGGVAIHTKAAVRIAVELCRLDMFNFNQLTQDIIVSSIILHDGCKNGMAQIDEFGDTLEAGSKTVTKHPLIVGELIFSLELTTVSKDIQNAIIDNISTHMGQWNKDFKTGQAVLPIPETRTQKFVHMCDYLASRKCLTIDINEPYTRN